VLVLVVLLVLVWRAIAGAAPAGLKSLSRKAVLQPSLRRES